MLTKHLLDSMFHRIRKGAVTVVYWDGDRTTYGVGEPYCTIHFKDSHILPAMIKNLSLAMGEGYMDQTIEIDGPLDSIVRLTSENAEAFKSLAGVKLPVHRAQNVRSKQAEYIQHHYDLGNDFYRLWLDHDTMAYTCAYYTDYSNTLEEAQTNKLNHVLRKLQLSPGMTVAELGCGWGHLLVKAAKDYGVSGIGVTLSSEQHKYATELAKREGVSDRVIFELTNYQDLAERGVVYDRVYSVGMLEHVGQGNHRDYFKVVDTLLKPGGISLLHSITNQREHEVDAWIDKYIFPGGYIPAVREITALMPEYDFRMIDYENLRMHYALTLDEWWRRFELHKDEIIEMYDEPFYRMWRFWLACSSGSFRYGAIDLSQWVFTKGINNDLPLTREHIYKSSSWPEGEPVFAGVESGSEVPVVAGLVK